MKVIDKILKRSHRLQETCFGTPVYCSVYTFKFNEFCKTFSVRLSGDGGDVLPFLFDSTMPDDALYDEWGRCKDAADKLLDELVGHKVTSAGNLKQG